MEVGRRTAWLTGGRVQGLIRTLGVPCQYDSVRRSWMVPVDWTDELIVFAEHVQRRAVTVTAVDR